MNCIYCHKICATILDNEYYQCHNHKDSVNYYIPDQEIWFRIIINDNLYTVSIELRKKFYIFCHKTDRHLIELDSIPYISPETAEEFISNLEIL